MRENGGELPVTYAAGLMTFPEPLRLIARPAAAGVNFR